MTSELAAALPMATPPFTTSLIAAGGSNLTSLVTDAAGERWILREPPRGHKLQSAHDMSREWRVLSGLHGHYPVPEPIAVMGDGYLMSFADGTILRDGASATAAGPQYCRAGGASVIEALAALHALDADAVGLGELGAREAYVARQLKRWRRQVEADPAREVPLLFELHDRLSASIPTEQRPGAIVHGDYRVDNCVLDPAGTVIAVLDWEMATLGDPLADLAWLVAVWGDALDSFSIVRDAPTVAPGFETRAQVAERYARASGLDLDPLPWYLAFTYWKQGCIVEGVYARRRRGVTAGAEVTDIEGIATQADKLFEVAAARLADV